MCIGTTAWLSCHVPFKKTNLLDYLATMPSAIHGRNMVSAEQGAAGKCLDVFVHNWLYPADGSGTGPAPADVYQDLERIVARVAPGSDGLLFLPWLNGAGPPSGDSTMRGGFLNQSLRTGRAEAARAIMEGVAFNLRWLQASVERFVGRRFESLNFIGGCAVRSCGARFWPTFWIARSARLPIPKWRSRARRDGCAGCVGSHARRLAPLAGADSKHVYPRSPAPRGVRPTVRRVRQQL